MHCDVGWQTQCLGQHCHLSRVAVQMVNMQARVLPRLQHLSDIAPMRSVDEQGVALRILQADGLGIMRSQNLDAGFFAEQMHQVLDMFFNTAAQGMRHQQQARFEGLSQVVELLVGQSSLDALTVRRNRVCRHKLCNALVVIREQLQQFRQMALFE